MSNCDCICNECGYFFTTKLSTKNIPTCPVCESLNVKKLSDDLQSNNSPYGNPHSSCGGGCSKGSKSSCLGKCKH